MTAGSRRFDSWKEIAAYFDRHVTTVRRWERHEGLPVHRHLHDKIGSVYAFQSELDAWSHSRRREGFDGAAEGGRASVTIADIEGVADQAPARRHLDMWSARALVGAVALSIVATIGLAMLKRPAIEAAGTRITSIAVLPLENLTGDPAQEFLADGMSEALITRLAQIRALRVVSRTSAMAFKDGRVSLPEVARQLRVDAVLRGAVQRSGDNTRITLQLIHGQSDSHLWARSYERASHDLLNLQAQVASSVALAIRIQTTAAERVSLAAADTVDPAAYQEYLVGRYHMWRDDEEHLKRAIAHFERATQIDPTYAAAFAGLSRAWWTRGMFGTIGLRASEAPARAASQRALALDGGLAEAYVVESHIKRLYDRNFPAAEELIKQALARDPQNVDAHHAYALLLMALGRFPEAIAHIESAEQIDPLSPAIHSDYGRILYRAGRLEEALPRLRRALALEPSMRKVVHQLFTVVYEEMGLYDRALTAWETGGLEPQSYTVARILARMGRQTEASQLIDELQGRSARSQPVRAASAYAALGNKDAAFTLLFASIDQNYPSGWFLAVDPHLKSLHGDPRWPEVLRRMSQPVRADNPSRQ